MAETGFHVKLYSPELVVTPNTGPGIVFVLSKTVHKYMNGEIFPLQIKDVHISWTNLMIWVLETVYNTMSLCRRCTGLQAAFHNQFTMDTIKSLLVKCPVSLRNY